MAETPETTTTDESQPKKKSSLKTIIMVAGVLIAEGALIIAVMMLAGQPAPVQASTPGIPVELPEDERIEEVLILDDRLSNARTGVTFVYETEVYIQTRKKHHDRVSLELEQFSNEIKSEIGAIWRTAEPHHFQEPKLQSLTRRVYTLLNDRFGADEDSGEPIVEKCVIVMGTGFRVDG